MSELDDICKSCSDKGAGCGRSGRCRLLAEKNRMDIEAKRLDGIGQEYEEERIRLVSALNDIGGD